MVFTKKSLFAGSIVFFSALGVLLSTQPSWYLQNTYLTGLIGSLVYILLPIFLVYFKSIPFIQLKTTHWEYNAIYNWSIGSVIIFSIYTLFYLLFKTPLEVFFYIILSLSIAYDGFRLLKKDPIFDEIIAIPKFTKKSAIFVGLFLCALVYYYLLYWRNWAPAYTQLTDLLNHNTVANSILQGRFAWFPSQLTDSIQLDSYLTVFHLQLAMARLFFSAFNLFEFQFVMQFVLLGFTFKLFQTFLSLFSKYWWVVILTALLVIIPNAPTLSFIRYAVVPNEVVFLLAPVVIYMLNFSAISVRDKIVYLIIISLSAFSFHFITTLLLSPVIILYYYRAKLESNKIRQTVWVMLLISTALILINVLLLKINLSAQFVNLLGLFNLKSDTFIAQAQAPVWLNMKFYALYMSPALFSLIFLIIGLYFKKIASKFYFVVIPAVFYYIITQLSIPFSDRLSSLILVFITPLLILSLIQFKEKIATNISVSLVLIVLISIGYGVINKVDDYPTYQFWTTENAQTIKMVDQNLQDLNIDSKEVYTTAEPMTKMQIQSLLMSPGAGTYMLTKERDSIYKYIRDGNQYCGDSSKYKYNLVFINPRFFQWYDNHQSYKSNIDNVWFDYGTDYQMNLKVNDFRIPVNAQVLVEKQSSNMRYFIIKCI